jgi:Domain of unknown function (DUF4252)
MKLSTLIGLFLLIAPTSALAQSARLQLDHLDRLAGQAVETVNVAIDPTMLKLASAFLKADGDQAVLKEMLTEVSGIYVRTFEFERENVYTSDDVTTIRKQLTSPGWMKLVTIDSKRDRDLVEVYSWREGNESGGLAILVAEPRELTVVNIVGRIDLAKLAALQGNFGIPRLRIDPPPANR